MASTKVGKSLFETERPHFFFFFFTPDQLQTTSKT